MNELTKEEIKKIKSFKIDSKDEVLNLINKTVKLKASAKDISKKNEYAQLETLIKKSSLKLQYEDFKKTYKKPTLPFSEQEYTSSIKKQINEHIKDVQKTIDDPNHSRLTMLRHKFIEVKKKIKREDYKLVDEIASKIWKPNDKSDFRRVIPEMHLVSDKVDVSKKDFFGNETSDTHDLNDKLRKEYDILAILTSTSRQDQVPGRKLQYVVKDKITRQILGVICITGTLAQLSRRNYEVFGDPKAKGYFTSGSRMVNCMANGQKIVATQPFGYLFNGGKLLSLLCLSDKVQNDWEKRYKCKMVTLDTTSLYGNTTSESQYHGLRPFYEDLGFTSPTGRKVKPTDYYYELMKDYLEITDNEKWFEILKAKTPLGQNFHRTQKDVLISVVMSKLGIESNLKSANTTRGVFFSRLYSNADEYLRNEINEDELKRAWRNDIDFITEYWRFGFEGDSRGYVHPDVKELEINLREHIKERIKESNQKQIEFDNRKNKLDEFSKQIENKKIKLQKQKDKLNKSQIQNLKQEISQLSKELKEKLDALEIDRNKFRPITKKDKRINTEMRSSAKRRLRSHIISFAKEKYREKQLIEVEKKLNDKPQTAEYYARKLKVKEGIGHKLPSSYTWYYPIINLNWEQTKKTFSAYLEGKSLVEE